MRKLIAASLVMALLIGACGDNSVDENTAPGFLKVEAFDAPPPLNVDAINLHIVEVSAHHVENGWMLVATPDSVFNFLELVNGLTAVLVDTTLPSGPYTQLRLVVSDSNEVIIDSVAHPLTVPSGEQTGVKIRYNFDVPPEDTVTVYVDFDADKSIVWTPGDYLLKPSYRAIRADQAVKVSGTVSDTAGTLVENALVRAIDGADSVSTLTDTLGEYTLVLTAGTYDISVSATGYTSADTTYSGVSVDPLVATKQTGFDFVLE